MREGINQMLHVQRLSPASPLEDRDVDELLGSDSEDDDVDSVASPSSDGPLSELSSLREHLPIRRGLSKFYQGKSQSYRSLASVRSVEDLAKKEIPFKRKIKSCRSYAGGLDGTSRSPSFAPGKTIAKKTSSSSSSSSSSSPSSRVSAMRSCSSDAPLSFPSQKNL